MAVHLGELTMNCRGCLNGKKTVCEYEIPGQEIWELNFQQYQGCPYKIVTRESANFLRAFQFYRSGYLPNQGAWIDQSAKMLDAFEVIEREIKEMELEQERKRKKFQR